MTDRTGGAAAPNLSGPVASVVIPAHNEAAVIDNLLQSLTEGQPGRFEIIVVCNGCTDDTAEVARSYGPDLRVIEIEPPSKRAALARGDDEATAFPRLYVDADVEMSSASAGRLVTALADESLHAAAPERSIPRDGVSRLVRWYYDVWERLPQVRSGLFGRGVIALSETGNARVRALPAMMGDDLAASDAFEPHECMVVEGSRVVIWPPRTMRDLLRRRIRAVTGNTEADRAGVRRASTITSPRTLLDLVRSEPRLLPRLPVFLGVAVVSRLAARRAIRTGDTDTWLRDESSRADR